MKKQSKYKAGDYVIALGYDIINDGNGFAGKRVVQLYPQHHFGNDASGMLANDHDFQIDLGSKFRIKESHIERLATKAEIKGLMKPKQIYNTLGGYTIHYYDDSIKVGYTTVPIEAMVYLAARYRKERYKYFFKSLYKRFILTFKIL